MIAITNPGPYAGLPTVTAPETITLTPTIINQIPANIIGNATITELVKTMLLNIIRENPLVTAEAHTRLAEYAGIIRNANNTISYSSENASLDKLTFYVMFRLPYTHADLEYGDVQDGLTSQDISSDSTTWAKYANHIRDTSSSIPKLRSEGINANITDPDTYYKTREGYNSVGGFRNDPEVNGHKDGNQEYEAALFDNIQTSNKIPISFFRMAQDENGYISMYKDNNYRRPHWPIGGLKEYGEFDPTERRTYYEREVNVYSYNPLENVLIPINNWEMDLVMGRFIERNSNNVFYIGNLGYQVELKDSSDTFFDLEGAVVLFYKENTNNEILGYNYNGEFRAVARRPDLSQIAMTMNRFSGDNRRFLIEMYNENGTSGVTYGAGIDSGAAFVTAYQRDVTFEINFANNVTSFKICLAREKSENITFSTSDSFKLTLFDTFIKLLKDHLKGAYIPIRASASNPSRDKTMDEKLVEVTKNTDRNYTITIHTSIKAIEPNTFFLLLMGLQLQISLYRIRKEKNLKLIGKN